MPYSYCSLNELKTRLAVPNADHDATLRRVLESASRAITEQYGRRFQPYTATRYIDPEDAYCISVPDLLSVTTLKTLSANSSGTRTYGYTWASTDYDLSPVNAANDEEPYTRVDMNPMGRYSFTLERQSVQLAGLWGYWSDTPTTGTTITEDLDTSETGVDVASVTAVETLWTILIDAEPMYVTATATGTLTVERAQAGVTGAAHTSGATIYRYRYPSNVVEATALLASRLYNRINAPFGVVGTPELGMSRIMATDPDVRALMQPFRRLEMAAV